MLRDSAEFGRIQLCGPRLFVADVDRRVWFLSLVWTKWKGLFADVSLLMRSYAVEVDFKPLGITPEVVVNDTKRIEARKAIKKMFQERYTQGKNKWFFSKLRF